MRVIIPPSLRNRLLQELHEEHPGIVAIKAIARSYIWWPNLNAEIELTGKTYEVCQAVRNARLVHSLTHSLTHARTHVRTYARITYYKLIYQRTNSAT